MSRHLSGPASSEEAPIHLAKREITVHAGDKATCIVWSYANEFLLVGFDKGLLIKYNATTGAEVARSHPHQDRINRLSFNAEKTLLVTSSKDCDAKLIDPVTLAVLKVYNTDRPVNGAVISPTHPHVILGGGQEAMKVTTTGAAQGKFESKFFHIVYGDEFGRVKGHFGPINAMAVHPFGKSFASGSEDGFVLVFKVLIDSLMCFHTDLFGFITLTAVT